jgi:hypothetical protein
MKVATKLLLAAASIDMTAASNQRKLRGNHENKSANDIEDVAFWTNLQRHIQYMSMPSNTNNEPLTLNSVQLSTLAPSDNETGSPTSSPIEDDDASNANVVPTPAPQIPKEVPSTTTATPSLSISNTTSSPTTFEATPFPTQLHERTSLKQFTCPSPSFVGCTDPNPVHPSNECDIVGELCGDDMYCCQDDCPRNYCTGKSG